MARDEYEKFEISDFDLQNEFTSSSRKRLTKEEQIYGVWAYESEDDDNENAYSKSKSFPHAMNFVSGGIQQSGKKEEKITNEEKKEEEEDVPAAYPKPMFSTRYDSSDDDEENDVFSNHIPSKNEKSQFSMAGFRPSANLIQEGAFGSWEKHTTGIGSKLMKKMGYEEGKGLGKNLQGIAAPVEASKRKGKGAIGYYGREKKPSIPKLETPAIDKDDKSRNESSGRWRKSRVKKAFTYKTADEIIKEDKSGKMKLNSMNFSGTKVIDMTGPETRVLSGYSALASRSATNDSERTADGDKCVNFDVPELIYNLDLLIEKTEESIVKNDHTLKNEENKVVHLKHVMEKYDTLLSKEQKELEEFDQALFVIDKMDSKHKNNDLSLEESIEMFSELKKHYPNLYFMYDLAYLSNTYVLPHFKKMFLAWNPLVDATSHVNTAENWQEVLENDVSKNLHIQPTDDRVMDPYHRLLWESWASVLRNVITNYWNPKDFLSLLAVLNSWKPPLIPPWMYSNILKFVVLPKITQAVNEWNPMQDTIPIHTWLHPWLPLLSDSLQSVYPLIRQKLSSALLHWHPSDRSAKMVLQPWKGVFSEISMAALIQSSVQPKLEASLHDMPINPHNQKLDAWNWFLDWENFLQPQSLSSILERTFFPKWFQALATWLSLNPNYRDILAWYKYWRNLIPIKVRTTLSTQQKFKQAIEICNRALNYQPGASEDFSAILKSFENIGKSESSRMDLPSQESSIISNSRENLSMRELVERKSQEKGVIFHPIPDRLYEGRPVYKLGRFNVAFKKNIIYVQEEIGWVPTSLLTLFDDL